MDLLRSVDNEADAGLGDGEVWQLCNKFFLLYLDFSPCICPSKNSFFVKIVKHASLPFPAFPLKAILRLEIPMELSGSF